MAEIKEKQKAYILPIYREVYSSIKQAACDNFNIDDDTLLNDPDRNLCYIRHLCVYLIKKNFNDLSYDKIGLEFNLSEHPARYGYAKIDAQKNIYGGIMTDLKAICKLVNSFESKKFVWQLTV